MYGWDRAQREDRCIPYPTTFIHTLYTLLLLISIFGTSQARKTSKSSQPQTTPASPSPPPPPPPPPRPRPRPAYRGASRNGDVQESAAREKTELEAASILAGLRRDSSTHQKASAQDSPIIDVDASSDTHNAPGSGLEDEGDEDDEEDEEDEDEEDEGELEGSEASAEVDGKLEDAAGKWRKKTVPGLQQDEESEAFWDKLYGQVMPSFKIKVPPSKLKGRSRNATTSHTSKASTSTAVDLESESSPATFVIPLKVPIGTNTVKDIRVDSTAKWETVRRSILSVMIPPSRLAYIPSWEFKSNQKNPAANSLDDAEEWQGLTEQVRMFVKSQSRGKNGVKPYHVRIVPLIESNMASAAPVVGKNTKAKQKARGSMSAAQGQDAHTSENEDNAGEPASAAYARVLAKLQRIWYCQKCDKACAFKIVGKHREFSMWELSTWIRLVSGGDATVDVIPPQLKIVPPSNPKDAGSASSSDVAAGAPREADPVAQSVVGGVAFPYAGAPGYLGVQGQPSAVSVAPHAGIYPPMGPLPGYPPLPLPPPIYGYPPMPYAFPPAPPYMPQTPRHHDRPHRHRAGSVDSSPSQSTSRSRRRYASLEISDDEQVQVDYPTMYDWLLSLDNDPYRGRDQLHFVGWAQALWEQRIARLDDFHLLTEEQLRQYFEMPLGIALQLKKWAREDITELQRRARRATKRLRF